MFCKKSPQAIENKGLECRKKCKERTKSAQPTETTELVVNAQIVKREIGMYLGSQTLDRRSRDRKIEGTGWQRWAKGAVERRSQYIVRREKRERHWSQVQKSATELCRRFVKDSQRDEARDEPLHFLEVGEDCGQSFAGALRGM